MKFRSILFMAATVVLSVPLFAATTPQTLTFKGAATEQIWPLAELNRDLPSDWSGYDFLVIELKASSTQRFSLILQSGKTTQRRTLQPLANVWIRASVPLQYFRAPNRAGHSLASVGKVPRESFWMSTGGTYGPLAGVTGLGFAMPQPLGEPTIAIRAVRLAREDPGSDVLEGKPVVDEFGQWRPASWPGKITGLAALQAAWAAEAAGLPAADSGWCKYGGYTNRPAKATGFFRVEQVDGRWWFVDPDGHLFFSTSCTGVGFGSGDARIAGREDFFAALPPADLGGDRRPGGFYAWNLGRRHGDGARNKAADLAFRRLDAWGFNTLGNWSDSSLWAAGRKPYQVNLGDRGMRDGFMGMPDVYSEAFVTATDRDVAAQCAPRKNDPWLLGYFLGNEPPWPGRESLVVDIILESKKPSDIQREARAFLAQGDTPERRKEFIYRAFQRFLEVTIAAVRRHDPNHLILGLRFGGGGALPAEMLHACRAFDVYSLNVYSTQVDVKRLEEIQRATGRPILIGEFHFGVPGRGLAAGLVQVRDQAERGVAYRNYVEQAAAFPAIIGTSWFQWVDQPVTGRMDGENYNIGLVDVTDRPYTDLIEAARVTHQRVQAVHAGTVAPFAAKPRAQ